MYRDDWAFDHHPACRGGCGQLADECACPRPRPLGSMTVTGLGATNGPVWAAHDDHLHRLTCKWRGCNLEVDRHGLCDVHLGTL